MSFDPKRLTELLYEALETEMGGVEIYEAAVRSAVDPELKKEWMKYLAQTKRHVEIVLGVFEVFDLNPAEKPLGRRIVHGLGAALVAAINAASQGPDPRAAEIVAGECVVLAETKDHLNWKLLGECVKHVSGEQQRVLREAVAEIEVDEDEHLYHTTGWTRELWLKSLGLRAVVPPPEEQKDVKTAIGAARAEQQRGKMRSKREKV